MFIVPIPAPDEFRTWRRRAPAVWVGASGAVSGVVGMFFVLFPRAPVDLHVYLLYWRVTTWRSTGLAGTGVWFVEQLALAVLSSVTGIALAVAFWAHVGGFLSGVVLGFLLGRLTLAVR